MGELVADPRVLTGLVCQGRALVDGASVGEVCGVTFTGRAGFGSLLDQARVAGWKIGTRVDGTPDAMCARCARPDPATVALLKELRRPC